MEIIKQDEHFTLKDTTEQGWTVTGSASKNAKGSISMLLDAVTFLDEFVGHVFYKKSEDQLLEIQYNVPEKYKAEFMTYVDSVVDFVLSQF